MVAATEKKRGRPKDKDLQERIALENAISDSPRSTRATQNAFYAEQIGFFVMDLEDYSPELYDFFTDARGRYKKCGILEQIGRMVFDGTIAGDDEVYGLLKACFKAYNMGLSSKDIEKRLREVRKNGGIKRAAAEGRFIDNTGGQE